MWPTFGVAHVVIIPLKVKLRDSFKDLEPYFQNESMWLEGEHKNVQMCMNVHEVQVHPIFSHTNFLCLW
jgi:hypothetical protein